MSVKGVITGNDPADRLIEYVRRFAVNESENELTRRVEAEMPHILTAERNRIIAAVRGRWASRIARRSSQMTDVGEVQRSVSLLLDDMESDVSA